MPKYKHASYANETITLENAHLRLELFKRRTGWGWGELFSASGSLVAVLDHFGELMLRDQEIPMRLEAQGFTREHGDFGERLCFEIKSLIMKDKLRGTSFEQWINYPLDLHCLEGTFTITLAPDAALLRLEYRLKSNANQYARYVRGPWLKVGQDGFGSEKTDAIFPGIEWLEGREWSSGTDWFKDPWAQRSVPHPNKVTAPVMALSHNGIGIGLAWNPRQHATGWFNDRRHHPQPVFASPNFIDRRENHLLGLMLPEVPIEALENRVYAEPPLELRLDQLIEFDAEVFLVEGDSLTVMTDWVKRHGLPEIAERWPTAEALERIARAYNTHLWHEGRGFGTAQTPTEISAKVPRFLGSYISRNPETALAVALREKLKWCQSQPQHKSSRNPNEALEHGLELLKHQREDGSFPFDPDGRHYAKDDFVVAREFLEPMGLAMDTALDMTMLPALEFLELFETTGDLRFRDAARKALECCLPLRRPEGGDYWETPLHAPNLLAAGHAAVAYYRGHQTLSDGRYLEQAIHWIRSLLPFTHLWEPADKPMLYNTKPCLCSSDWYFANWVRDHVQWEVLETFALSLKHGIDWGLIDPEIDWHAYHRGITLAATRWMLDHTQDTWRPHNLPSTLELYRLGLFDDCLPDTHNSTTGLYGGMAILPDVIAVNLLGLLEREP